MRKVIVLEHITLDGVIQAPGGSDEDTRAGFVHGQGGILSLNLKPLHDLLEGFDKEWQALNQRLNKTMIFLVIII